MVVSSHVCQECSTSIAKMADIPLKQPFHQPPVVVMSQPQQVVIYPLHSLRDNSMPIQCPSCSQIGYTTLEYKSGSTTHLWALVSCLCFCAGCVPYLFNAFKDVEHHCSFCGIPVAHWSRRGATSVYATQAIVVAPNTVPV
jgi:hypothetical protein